MLGGMKRDEYKDLADARMEAIGRECEPCEFEPDREIPYAGLTLGATGSSEADDLVQHFSRAHGFHLEPQGSLWSVLSALADSEDAGVPFNWSAVEMSRQRHLAAQARRLKDSIEHLGISAEYGDARSAGVDSHEGGDGKDGF